MNKLKKLKILAHTKYVIATYMDKELTLFAASLSFYTLFSFIPLLLIVMTFLTSLDIFSNMYLQIQSLIFNNLLPVISEIVMSYIDDFLQNSVGISAFSTVMLLLSSVFFYQNYEFIVNRIFRAPQRVFLRSMGVYLLILFVTPIALGIVFYLSGEFITMVAHPRINLNLFIPYLIIWILFFILYVFSANVKVHFRAAFISSFIISIIFSLSKNMFIYYVVINHSYATIYGSFSVLIFLFLWIYISWIIFIFGLKLCYLINRIYQHRDAKAKHNIHTPYVLDAKK